MLNFGFSLYNWRGESFCRCLTIMNITPIGSSGLNCEPMKKNKGAYKEPLTPICGLPTCGVTMYQKSNHLRAAIHPSRQAGGVGRHGVERAAAELAG